ncbi:MAG TPA: squalene/phytoene synthase family protein, partial [Marivita sp.]|nr:squalene/phytoene synthase family protein [Marivita sp.]
MDEPIKQSSFATAARLLDARTADATRSLYRACRAVDDLADQTGGAVGHNALDAVADDLSGQSSARTQPGAVFQDLQSRYGMSLVPARLLVKTVQVDIRHRPFRSVAQLDRYAQGVAGTVGLMMADLFGVTDPLALRRASALGRAMQMSNIARDVIADAQLGRRYLPAEWCDVPPDHLRRSHMHHDPALRRAVAKTLGRAERLYAIGLRGLPALPVTARVGVAAAAVSYRDIGRRIARRDFRVSERPNPGSVVRRAGLGAVGAL